MAIQSLTSSSALPTSTNGTSTDTGTDGNDLNSRNSVPFSFLIAFLALFVVFMGLGLWARRIVFFARRRMGLPVPEPPPRQRDIKSRKPVLWDVYPDKRGRAERWSSIDPLSTWYCREMPPPSTYHDPYPIQPGWPPSPPVPPSLSRGPARVAAPTPPTPTQTTSLTPRSIRDRLIPLNHLREWWLDLTNPMRHAPPKCADAGKGRVDALQVAVFIAMPSRPAGKTHGLDQLGEMSIGIAGTRWEHDDSALEAEAART